MNEKNMDIKTACSWETQSALMSELTQCLLSGLAEPSLEGETL